MGLFRSIFLDPLDNKWLKPFGFVFPTVSTTPGQGLIPGDRCACSPNPVLLIHCHLLALNGFRLALPFHSLTFSALELPPLFGSLKTNQGQLTPDHDWLCQSVGLPVYRIRSTVCGSLHHGVLPIQPYAPPCSPFNGRSSAPFTRDLSYHKVIKEVQRYGRKSPKKYPTAAV